MSFHSLQDVENEYADDLKVKTTNFRLQYENVFNYPVNPLNLRNTIETGGGLRKSLQKGIIKNYTKQIPDNMGC